MRKEGEMSEQLSAAETARLARQALEREFPGVEFSVTVHRYDGGTSLSVQWTDGPEREAVDKVVQRYAGAEFNDAEEKVPRAVWREVQFGVDYVFTERFLTAQAGRGSTIAATAADGSLVVIAETRHVDISEGGGS
jgi:hypothetical protein